MNTFIRHLGRTKAEEVFTTENVKDRQREHNHAPSWSAALPTGTLLD